MKTLYKKIWYPDDLKPAEGEQYLDAKQGKVVEGEVIDPSGHIAIYHIPQLLESQEARIDLIEVEAAERITATDWKLQRVEERNRRGKKSQADVDAILDMRDQIRIDSDTAEAAVMALTTIEEVKAFTW